MNEPRPGFVLTLDTAGEQLHVDRPFGEQYCNFALISPDGSVHAYFSGYNACVALVASRAHTFPFLRIGGASIPLPANEMELRRLAKFMAIECPEAVEASLPQEEL